jgi:hypothetical protein
MDVSTEWELLSDKRLLQNLVSILENQNKMTEQLTLLSTKITTLEEQINPKTKQLHSPSDSENDAIFEISGCDKESCTNDAIVSIVTDSNKEFNLEILTKFNVGLSEMKHEVKTHLKLFNKLDEQLNEIKTDNKIYQNKIESNNQLLDTISKTLSENREVYMTALNSGNAETMKILPLLSSIKDTNDKLSPVLDSRIFVERLSSNYIQNNGEGQGSIPHQLWSILSKNK